MPLVRFGPCLDIDSVVEADFDAEDAFRIQRMLDAPRPSFFLGS